MEFEDELPRFDDDESHLEDFLDELD